LVEAVIIDAVPLLRSLLLRSPAVIIIGHPRGHSRSSTWGRWIVARVAGDVHRPGVAGDVDGSVLAAFWALTCGVPAREHGDPSAQDGHVTTTATKRVDQRLRREKP